METKVERWSLLTFKEYENAPVDPELVFDHVGAEYYLVRVAKGDAEARAIPLPRKIGERAATHVAIALTPAATTGGGAQ